MKEEPFSKRLGHYKMNEKEITVHNDAPLELRNYIPIAFYARGKDPSELRNLVCRLLKVPPDYDNNWSEYPNIEREVRKLLQECDWFLIYDVIEEILTTLSRPDKTGFTQDINDFFITQGIGYKIEDDEIELRGSISFETSLTNSKNLLKETEHLTASKELKEALTDLSRRPEPDITGAIQHSGAALECVIRQLLGDDKTLGDLLKRYKGAFPRIIEEMLMKIWGYASEQGRHLKEGKEPDYLEAELIVHLCASICTYLVSKSLKPEADDF